MITILGVNISKMCNIEDIKDAQERLNKCTN